MTGITTNNISILLVIPMSITRKKKPSSYATTHDTQKKELLEKAAHFELKTEFHSHDSHLDRIADIHKLNNHY
jgi:hypothetical protein